MAVRTGTGTFYASCVAAPRWSRWWPAGRDWPVDVALALAATAMNVAGAIDTDETIVYELRPAGPALASLVAAAGLALLWRRTRPLASFLAVVAITCVVVAFSWQPGFLPFTLLLAAYALGAFGSSTQHAIGLGAAFAGITFLFVIRAPYFDSVLGVAVYAQVAAAWVLGRAVAHQRRAAERARERSILLARDSARQAERAVLEERVRVAGQLNEAVTDTLTAITLQAAAQRESGVRSDILNSIERSSRSATDDLRRILRALRGRPADGAVDGRDQGLHEALLRESGWTPASAEESPADPSTSTAPIGPVDLALGLCVVLLNVTGAVVPDDSTTTDYVEPVLPVLVALAAVPGLALVLRRHHPVASFLTVLVAVSTVIGLGWPEGNLPGSLVIAAYALGAWAPLRGAALGLLAAYGGVVAAVLVLGPPPVGESGGPASTLIFAAAWLLGVVIRRRRTADQQALDRLVAAERELTVATERAIGDARLAVARDLHDLVGHNLSAITVQAAAARRSGEDSVSEAMRIIELAGRSALTDLRGMLSALQRGAGDGDLAPAPGLSELRRLVDLHRAAHGPVELTLDDALADEPDSVRLTAYRLVQEALTNVAKHAPGVRATVRVQVREGGVGLLVENDAAPGAGLATDSAGPGTGLGLVGMRERVRLFGGSLDAAATPTGGFLVRAELQRAASS